MIQNLSPSVVFENDKKYTGFLLDIKSDPRDLRKLVNLKSSGYLIKDNEISEWLFNGYIYKEQTYIFGPFFEGKPLKEILSLPSKDSLQMILKLIEAIESIQLEYENDFKIQLDSVFFLNDGGILFLPFEVISEIKDISFDDYKTENYCKINYPYFKDPEFSLSYSIGIILYKSITGIFPFDGSSEEEINKKFRNQKAIKPKMLNFEIKEDVSETLNNFLNKKNTLHKTVMWKNIVKNWIENGITGNIPDDQKNYFEIQSKKFIQSNEKNYSRKVFLEKNAAKISTISIISIIILIISLYSISIITKSRSTKGYSPLKIVETYYKSFNSLDATTLEECVEKDIAKEDINEITYLFLFDKQTQAYEYKSYFIPADKWVKDGKKEINPPYIVFGITSLSINQDQSGDNQVFTSNYEKWKTIIVTDKSGKRDLEGTQIKEKLYLKKFKIYWIIYKIEKIEENKIQ